MNRFTRITSILTHLLSRRIVTANELAIKFDVSKRTIYRDIQTLIEAGIPIGAENGVGHFIVEGYSLPPIALTEREANTLVILESMINNQGDQSLKADFESLLIKIKSTLKFKQKKSVEILENLIAPSVVKDSPKSNVLSDIQNAIAQKQVLLVYYNSIYKLEKTKRNIEPLGIYYTKNAWITIAYCHLRKELREFRLDRIERVFYEDVKRAYKKDFDLGNYFDGLKSS